MWTAPDSGAANELIASARAKLGDELVDKLGPPFITALPPEWADSKHRLLVFGQESLEWGPTRIEDWSWPENGNSSGQLERFLETYEKFDFAKKYRGNSSPFWRAHGLLSRSLENGERRKVLWSNLMRSDTSPMGLSSASAFYNLSWEDIDKICTWQKDLIHSEIKNTNCNSVLFLTGPNYDYVLKKTFPNVDFCRCLPDVKERATARLESELLPYKSYRLYHPAYLQRSGQWEHLNQIAGLIAAS